MRRHVLALCLTSALLLATPAAMADEALDLAWSQAYDAVLRDPANPTLNQKYLELSIARQDYEAAIPPLERLLAQQPDNAGLILQLGRMYKLLGSSRVAEGYFETVRNHPQATDQLRAEAAALSRQ